MSISISKTLPPLLPGTVWTEVVGWEEAAHPWMSGYCGFFALELKRRFPQLLFALQSYQGHAAHILVHQGADFYDARGYLPDYKQRVENYDLAISAGLKEADIRASGLLNPKPGVRTLTEEEALTHAQLWLEKRGIDSLADFPVF